MPNLHEHLLFDQHFFGHEYGQYKYIHHLLDHGDFDFVKLFGHGHRKYMHDHRAVRFIFEQYGFHEAEIARAHIALDTVWTFSKRHGTKK